MQGARTDFVHLFDILGVPEAAADAEDHEAMQGFAAVPRSQACKVFSIALVLATRGEVDLIQEAPYADIKMVLSGKQLQIKEESDNEDEVEEGEGQNGGGEDEEVLRDVDMAEVAR